MQGLCFGGERNEKKIVSGATLTLGSRLQQVEIGNYLGYLPVSAWMTFMPQAVILCRPEYRYRTDPEPTLYRLQHALHVQVELMQFDDVCVYYVHVRSMCNYRPIELNILRKPVDCMSCKNLTINSTAPTPCKSHVCRVEPSQ